MIVLYILHQRRLQVSLADLWHPELGCQSKTIRSKQSPTVERQLRGCTEVVYLTWQLKSALQQTSSIFQKRPVHFHRRLL